MPMFPVLSSCKAIARVYSVHFDECRLSAKWPPTLGPSHLTWAVSLPVGCHHLHKPSPYIIILRVEADAHFTIPHRVECQVMDSW